MLEHGRGLRIHFVNWQAPIDLFDYRGGRAAHLFLESTSLFILPASAFSSDIECDSPLNAHVSSHHCRCQYSRSCSYRHSHRLSYGGTQRPPSRKLTRLYPQKLRLHSFPRNRLFLGKEWSEFTWRWPLCTTVLSPLHRHAHSFQIFPITL